MLIRTTALVVSCAVADFTCAVVGFGGESHSSVVERS
jgi:hypothetical protein